MPTPNDLGIFVQLLKELQGALAPGMTLLRPVLMAMMGLMVVIELITIGTSILLLRASIPAQLLRFFLRTSVLLALELSAPAVVTGLIDGFTRLGLLAGNNAIPLTKFMDPGQWLSLGFQTGQPLLNAWNGLGYLAVMEGLVYLVFWLTMIVAFAYMGFSLFVLHLQMTFCLVGAQVLLPFATSRFTAWMAQGAIAYPVNMAFRFFFKAMISCVVFVVLQQRAQALATLPPGTLGQQVQHLVIMTILPICFAVLFWKSDSIAGGLLQGLPALSTGHFLQAAAGSVLLASGAGAAAAGGARLAASATGGAIRAGTAASTGYQLGSATAMTSGGRFAQSMQHMVGGMRGVASVGMGAVSNLFSAATSPAMQALRQNVQAGRQAGWLLSGGTLPAKMTMQTPAPLVARPGPSFTTRLQQTLRTSAYLLNDHGHGGVTPHL